MGDLLRASRPFSWINTCLPFIAAFWAVHHSAALALVVGTVYFLGPYNLLLYGVNDLHDFESDRINPRKGGAIEGGLVSPSRGGSLWLAIAVTNIPCILVLTWAAGTTALIALGITVFAALAYSVPPLRTKVVPGLDSVTSSLHFVLPAVCGGLVAGAALGNLPWRLLVAFFLWGMASHALGAIQDVRYDREAGIGSIAVALGGRRTALCSLAGYSTAVVLVAGAGGGPALVAAAALLPYVLLAAGCLSGDVESQARRTWRSFLGLNLLTGFFVTQVLLHVWGAGSLTVIQLLAWGSAFGVLVLLVHTVANQRAMRRLAPPPEPWPRITVIVPARNEERSIAACLAGLCRQHYGGQWEIIVVDDGSTDRTASIARAILRPGDRLLPPEPCPPSWTGKCWAANQGTRAARGEILVFLDADTVLEPSALASLAGEIEARGGLISLLTRYHMDSRAERLFMPAFAAMQLCFLPIWGTNAGRFQPRHAYAYGPCMAVSRRAYEAGGGHVGIRASDREDVDLGRAIAAAGYPVRFLHGADLASTRHYRTVSEIAGCWRRTYFAYGGNSLAVALAGMLGITVVFLLPLILPFCALALGDRSGLVGALCGLVALLVLRRAIALRERQPLVTIIFHPVTWAGSLVFQALSVADGLRGRAPRWRGRTLPMETAR